jgi:NAD(P)-dependent dehydrogenase (short-subunit alcohol dehydrogenase family)
LITGGTQGVGSAIAGALAAAGCNLVLHGLRDDASCQATVDTCRKQGVDVRAVFADLSGPTQACIADLMQQVDALSVQPTLLVNNAGTFCDEPFLEMTHETFERTMRLNVYAGYFLTQAFARRWIPARIAGRVLFTGSINGELAEPNHTAYDTSKGGVRTMVRSLCVALAPEGIRVNSMAPGLVFTPLTSSALDDADARRWMELHTPNGRVPPAEVCGAAALFLLSDEAEHVHGQTLLVDGGMSCWQQPDLPDALRGKL